MRRADALAAKAEVRKLARLLDVDEAELAFAAAAPAAQLARFRDDATDVLFADDGGSLRRTAEAARLLPEGVLVRIARGALGPALCALLAGQVEPRTAVAIAQRLEPGYLAQVAARMDPRRAVAVVTALSPERIRDVAAEMAAAGEHVAMGRFVAHLSDEQLAACLEVLDGVDIVRVAFVLEGKERIERIVELLGDARIDRLAAEAAGAGLDDEVADLLAHLPPRLRRRLAPRARA
jgi:hypothetical protein